MPLSYLRRLLPILYFLRLIISKTSRIFRNVWGRDFNYIIALKVKYTFPLSTRKNLGLKFEKKKNAVLSTSIALAVLSGISICLGTAHICMYGAHPWCYGCGMRYYGDGIWGCVLAAIASILGICAGCTNDRKVFKGLYIAQATLVCQQN